MKREDIKYNNNLKCYYIYRNNTKYYLDKTFDKDIFLKYNLL